MPKRPYARISVPVHVFIDVKLRSKNEPDENAVLRACARVESVMSSPGAEDVLRELFDDDECVAIFPLDTKVAALKADIEDTFTLEEKP